MNKIFSIKTDKAPAAVGPYSQATSFGDFIFCSGQIALNTSGELAEGGIVEQTEAVLNNLLVVLTEGGADFSSVVKTDVFLKSMDDYVSMNEVYAKHFMGPVLPARAAVEVARLPKDVLVEIACIAIKK